MSKKEIPKECKVPKLFEIMNDRNIKSVELSKAIGVSTGNISDWRYGRSKPTYDKMIEIAAFLNVPVECFSQNGSQDKESLKSSMSNRKFTSKQFRLSGNIAAQKRKTLPADTVRWKRNIERVNALPDDSKKRVLAQIDALIDIESKQGQ